MANKIRAFTRQTSGMIDKTSCSSGSEVIKPFSYATQLSTKFILLINAKMPTIVGILTFISMINTSPEIPKARNLLFNYLSVF